MKPSPAFPRLTLNLASRMAALVMFASPAAAPGALPATAPSDDPSCVSREALDEAGAKAKDFLLARMNNANNCEAVPAPVAGEPGFKGRRWGELTALSVYALLGSGGAGERWQLAFNWLREVQTDDPGVLVWRDATCGVYQKDPGPGPGRKRLGESDALTLTRLMRPPGPAAGLFAPPVGPAAATRPAGPTTAPTDARPDLGASQAAVRALYTLSVDVGVEIPDNDWVAMASGWRGAQRPDGSWSANEGDPPAARLTTTADAVATLLLLRDQTLLAGRNWSDCTQGLPSDASLDAGLAWLDRHAGDAFSPSADPAALYALERVGLLTGRKYLGGIDWYAAGSRALLKSQKPDGSWPAAPGLTGADPDARLIPETAYALMFLAEGRGQVVISKLAYAPPAGAAVRDPGGQRPDDVSHFVEWSARELCEMTLGWQRVDLSTPLGDLLAAPILYVAGSAPLAFTPAQEQLLHDYVLRGGLIVGNADCANRAFAASFTGLGGRLFPGYAFRPLPADHPILAGETFKAARWPHPTPVIGMSNGVRELMLLIPDADLSRAWQTRSTRTRRDRYELGFDILCYSTERQPFGLRGEPSAAGSLRRDPDVKAASTIRVALLSYPGNWEPEPGGWERLSNLMHNESRVDLELTPVNLGDGKLDPKWFQAAHLTGTAALALSPAARDELAAFVDQGGTLIVDAAGGSAAFADSVEPVLAAAFGGRADDLGTVLPRDHSVYTPEGNRIDEFQYRRYCRGRIAGRLNVPRVRGIEKGGRVGVFYSREDLTAGLVGQPTDGIVGYAPGTATAIVRNMLLYAAGNRRESSAQGTGGKPRGTER